MAEKLYKLSPHRDLQCYFLTPTAVAAMSSASETGFTISGTWRQQFDWAVAEWNRDNVFEHPALRYLPDSDLSGLQLTYQETRTNCIPFESNLYPTVDWPNLRVWADDDNGTEHIYYVPIMQYATAVVGTYQNASATMTLTGTVTQGDSVGICMPIPTPSYPDQHYYYQVTSDDTRLDQIAAKLAYIISTQSQGFTATSNGPAITLTYIGSDYKGSNGNRITVYGFVSAGATESWLAPSVTLSGGTFPTTYQISLNFGSLSGYLSSVPSQGEAPVVVPTTKVRKLRWTWAADLQPESFVRTEFTVVISNWTVTGTGRDYFVAGPGSRRIEDDDPAIEYSGAWAVSPSPGTDASVWPVQTGNYSGSRIHFTNHKGDSLAVTYSESAQHDLYLGTRRVSPGSIVEVSIDGSPQAFPLDLPGEDVLVRLGLGSVDAGAHTIVVTNDGNPDYNDESKFYFDFLEIVYPSADLPDSPPQPQLSLATDWDTYHSQSLPAERTAWMINKLGFTGRVNHYAGALWFYELVLPGHVYNNATISFAQNSNGNAGYITIGIGPDPSNMSLITHLNLPDDTAGTVAQAFANLINIGYNAVWASATGDQLTITQRTLTPWINQPDPPAPTVLSVTVSPNGAFSATASSTALSGGVAGSPYDGSLDVSLTPITYYWRTDLNATPTINRAARDWSQAYFLALRNYGMDVVAAFSTELKNADPNLAAGLAQRRFDGSPVVVSTPAVMTNFSPACVAFWTRVYSDMAALQSQAGLVPYLQSGEVQWWYFPWNSEGEQPVSMPFYDAYTQQEFEAQYGVSMQEIVNNNVNPGDFPNEVAFLPTLIGACTAAIRTALQAQYPNCRYEVLYPTDTNDTPFNQLINFPTSDWIPANLTCLKTESFTFTGSYNLDQSAYSMSVSAAKGFLNTHRSHLVGIGEARTAWQKEVNLAQSQGLENVVLFALDQYCLVGYSAPPFIVKTRSGRQG